MIRFRFPLRNADTPGTPPAPPALPVETPIDAPAPPPVAKIVVSTARTEREMQLERDLESERERAKRAEMLAAQKTDEFHRYKTAVESPRPMPKAEDDDEGPFGFKRG